MNVIGAFYRAIGGVILAVWGEDVIFKIPGRWRMRFSLACLAICAANGFSSSVYAGQQGPGLISDLQINGSNVVFAVGGTATGRPACAAWERFVFDATTPSGQALLAYLLSAQASNKRVIVLGTGFCNVVSEHETAYSLRDGGP